MEKALKILSYFFIVRAFHSFSCLKIAPQGALLLRFFFPTAVTPCVTVRRVEQSEHYGLWRSM